MIYASVFVKNQEQAQNEIREPRIVNQATPALWLRGFRTAYVFDISQTRGRPLPEFAQMTGDPKDITEKLKAGAAKRRIAVEYDASIAPALGMSGGGNPDNAGSKTPR